MHALVPMALFKNSFIFWMSYPFLGNVETGHIRHRVRMAVNPIGDIRRWRLTGNGIFSVKSFYNFLIDGGLRCQVSRFFWRNWCPKKINLFNWLVWKNKILALENLARRICNKLPTDTCVMCHAGCKSVDHLFIHCTLAKQVWAISSDSLSSLHPRHL